MKTREAWGLKRGRNLLWKFYRRKDMADLFRRGDGGPDARVVRIKIRISEVRQS